MKRPRSLRKAHASPLVSTLTELAESYAQSTARLEDQYWEKRLDQAIIELIEERAEETLSLALDELYSADARAYDVLADTIESHCEAVQVEEYDVQLIIIPVLAWSRYSIPAVSLSAETITAISTQLQAHILADGAKLALLDHLFSPDQLPQGFCATAELAQELGHYALTARTLHIDPSTLPESMAFLADTRYVVGAVAVPRGTALFSWQEKVGETRSKALRNWERHGAEVLKPLMTGCVCEFLLPQAYFTACREADRASRPFSIAAATSFLTSTLNVPSSRLRAIIAPFHDEELEEYRISFTFRDAKEVLYGVVWPLLEAEDESSDLLSQIEGLLNEHGIESVQILDQTFPMEYCDDCGSPLYPNSEGETEHAEMPEEELEPIPRHLH